MLLPSRPPPALSRLRACSIGHTTRSVRLSAIGSGRTSALYALHRNGYSGMQRYAAFLWSGDVQSRWETLKNHIPIGINSRPQREFRTGAATSAVSSPRKNIRANCMCGGSSSRRSIRCSARPGQYHVGQFVERGQLPRPVGQRPRLLEVLGRMIADLLQRGEQLEHQTGPLDALPGGDPPPSSRGPSPRTA